MEPRLINAWHSARELRSALDTLPQSISALGIEETTDAINECQKLISQAEDLRGDAVSLYGGKFGNPIPIHEPVSDSAMDAALSTLCDNNLYNLIFNGPGKGLFARKLRDADYQRYCQSASAVAAWNRQRQELLECHLQSLYALSESSQQSWRDAVTAVQANWNPDIQNWGSYPSPISFSKELYLGDLKAYIEDDNMSPFVSAGLMEKINGIPALSLPFSYNAMEPFSLMISHSGDASTGTKVLRNIVRSMIYQIIHTLPPYSYEILYFDPLGSGTNLAELNSVLSPLVDGNAYWLHSKLYPDCVFHPLQIISTREDMREKLQKLDQRISDITTICGGQSVVTQNISQFDENGTVTENAETIIPQVFVFLENTHLALSRDSAEVFRKIVKVGSQAGITLVTTSMLQDGEPVTAEERYLLERREQENDMDHLYFQNGAWNIDIDGSRLGLISDTTHTFPLIPQTNDFYHIDYLRKVAQSFEPKRIENTLFMDLIKLDEIWGQGNSDNEIVIPVGVNNRGKVSTIALGGPEAPHALLAGSTGCGKSSFIHTLIAGIISHYKPTDVNLWLSDYKSAEFSRYLTNTPAHIRYVGIATSVRYSMSFLDRLEEEYNRRAAAFGSITSLAQYRRVHGPDSMPRIVVIIDEFHKMSDHAKDNPEYSRKLTNLLKESRAYGFTFLLADQTCDVGLEGLKEEAKKQLICRMAMKTDTPEYNAVFKISNAKDIIPVLNNYEILLQRFVKEIDNLGKQTTRIHYELCKTFYLPVDSPDHATALAKRAIDAYGPSMQPTFVREFARQPVEWENVTQTLQTQQTKIGQFPLALGTPRSIGNIFQFSVKDNYGENIISVTPNDGILSSMFACHLQSVLCGNYGEIFILADTNDDVFLRCEPWLWNLSKTIPGFRVCTDMNTICRVISEQYTNMEHRRSNRSFKRCFLFWLGMRDIVREMSHFSPNRPNAKQAPSSRGLGDEISNMEAMFAEMFGPSEPEYLVTSVDEPEGDECLYNAADDIKELLDEGPKRGIHSFVYYTAVNAAKQTRCVPIDGFAHRIALAIGRDDATDFLGSARYIMDVNGEVLNDDTAVYYNGRTANQFMPYITEWEAD